MGWRRWGRSLIATNENNHGFFFFPLQISLGSMGSASISLLSLHFRAPRKAVTVLHRERGGGMEQAMGRGRKTSLELLLLGAAQSRTVQRAAGRRAELPPPPAQPRGWGMDGASVERRRRGGSGVREGGSAAHNSGWNF